MPLRPSARYGLPQAARVIHRERFSVGYCPARRSALWVAEALKDISWRAPGVNLKNH